MSVNFPEPGDERDISPDAAAAENTEHDPRFEPQHFSLNDLVYLAEVGEQPHREVLRQFAACVDDFHAHIATAVASGVIEDALKFRGDVGAEMLRISQALSEAIRTLPEHVHEAGLPDELAITELSKLILATDKERVDLFSALAPEASHQFTRMNLEGAVRLLGDIYAAFEESGEDMPTEVDYNVRGIDLGNEIVSMMNTDLMIFGKALIEETQRRTMLSAAEKILADDEEGASTLAKRIGGHALDVAKIAAGVTIGMVLGNRFRKR